MNDARSSRVLGIFADKNLWYIEFMKQISLALLRSPDGRIR